MKPTTEQIAEYQSKELQEAQEAVTRECYNQFGNYNRVAKKIRGFLTIAGEKKSKETGELFREHIPRSVFGISSDEIATDLGISEVELMEKLTDGLSIRSPLAKRIRQTISKKVKTDDGVDITLVAPISQRKTKIRAYAVIRFGYKQLIWGRRYKFNNRQKLERKMYGFYAHPKALLYVKNTIRK